MAKYRQKDDVDLRWNKIRRRITRELDIQIADWREEALNKMLSNAWVEYVAALETGTKLELEAKYGAFVQGALSEVIGDPVIEQP